jgi:hypothetical protein
MNFHLIKINPFSVIDFWWSQLVPQFSAVVVEIGTDIFIFINTTEFYKEFFSNTFTRIFNK